MKHKRFKRCKVYRIITDKAVIACRYDVNHSLIDTYPPLPPNIMSLYRGTSPAALWDLAADLGGYVEQPD